LLKRMFWINLGLFIIVSLLSFNVYRVWLPIVKGRWKVSLPVSKRNVSAKETIPKEEEVDKPALYTYDLIADKDLFRPERTEWVPPPPPTEATTEQPKMQIPQYPEERNKPGMKKPTLYGIMITKDKKSAIMKGSIREDPQKRSRKVRLGNGEVRDVPLPPGPGKITDDKAKTYHIGDEISESQIVDILPDRVVLSKNGEEYELLLRESKATRNAQGPGQEAGLTPPNVQGDQREQNFPPGGPAVPPNFPPPPGYPGFQPPPGYPAFQPPPGFPAFQPPPQGQPGQPGFYPPMRQPGQPGFPPGAPPYQFQRPGYIPPNFRGLAPGRQGAPFINPFRGGGGPS
jgi:hypothetical protein